ncbi:FHA domain-containing protein [Christensenellaceae bacterium OttesenSCG-928-K19]|nr:FHA domain-containing protein [Christensenellaceae bacterium OttesenSCG-928-K19]
MDGAIYEVAAYAMRYWFILVIVGILVASIYISYKQYNEKKYVKGAMSKFFGYLEIVGGPEEFIGDRFGVREQNTIGSSQHADIILPDKTVLATHALLYVEEGDMILSPTSRSDTRINSRRAINQHKLKTGDIISIGDVDFYVYIKRTRIGNDS